MLAKRGALVVVMVGTAVFTLSACSGSDGSSSASSASRSSAAASDAPSAPASASASSSPSAEQLAAFSSAVISAFNSYKSNAAEYAKEVTAKDRAKTVAAAEAIQANCAAALRVPSSGDNTLDSSWAKFAAECQQGWQIMAQAFSEGKAALVAEAHKHIDAAQALLPAIQNRLNSDLATLPK